MKSIQTIMERMQANGPAPAIFWHNQEYSYDELFASIDAWDKILQEKKIGKGTICAILGDFSYQISALTFSLMKAKAIIVPFTKSIEHEIAEYQDISEVSCMFSFDDMDKWTFETYPRECKNTLTLDFLEKDVPGLIVFTSGSTGKPKGILQNCENVMKKFIDPRPGWKTTLFLMLDHFGGFNTFLSTFAYGGTAVCLSGRSPSAVCEAIAKSKATLLPTTPTFINLLIASKVYLSYDLSSIKIITYGTEVIPEATLTKLKEIFPNNKLKQTYGLSELGVLRSKSLEDGSVWVKVGGAGFETKIIDNILWVRSESNMVGYLNAPNPFDEDGWMCTEDHVEVKGEYLRILGRKTDIINIGGQKVFPIEVENVILQADNVAEAKVYARPHPLMGQVANAEVELEKPEDSLALNTRLKAFCMTKLAKHKVPVRFKVVDANDLHNVRFKKTRQVKTI